MATCLEHRCRAPLFRSVIQSVETTLSFLEEERLTADDRRPVYLRGHETKPCTRKERGNDRKGCQKTRPADVAKVTIFFPKKYSAIGVLNVRQTVVGKVTGRGR